MLQGLAHFDLDVGKWLSPLIIVLDELMGEEDLHGRPTQQKNQVPQPSSNKKRPVAGDGGIFEESEDEEDNEESF